MSPSLPLRQLSLWGSEPDAAPASRPEWRVRESTRARRLSVRVWRDGTVEIVVPRRTRPAEVVDFVARHRDWIERQRGRALARPVEPFPPAEITLDALERRWRCVGAGGGRQLVDTGSGELLLPAADERRLRRALLRWLALTAQQAFAPSLARLAAEMQVGYGRLQIRRQRTRWGSCSTRGTISLNACLLFQPPPVVRYLMVHELAHVTHMNHSPRFWRHVARFEPRWRDLDRELLRGWTRVPRWALA